VPSIHFMKVVIADSEPLIRDVIARVCTAELGYTIAAMTASRHDALAAVRRHAPDLVLHDLVLNGGDGFDVIRETAGSNHRTLVLSSCVAAYPIWCVSRCNVHGFMAKEELDVARLKDAIGRVAGGGQYWSEHYRKIRLQLITEPFSFVKVLTNAEMRVLGRVGRGMHDEEIAAQLGISRRTVQTHRTNISRKLGIHTSTKLMAYAITCGLDRFSVEQEATPLAVLPVQSRDGGVASSRSTEIRSAKSETTSKG